MLPLITVTLNPALDLSGAVPKVEPGPKLRLDAVLAEAGGGGINVARAAAALGGQARALAALGGATGARLAGLLADVPGLVLDALPAPGETRESLSVTETASGAQYRFVLPGPVWDGADAALAAAIAAKTPEGALIVLSGSQPPGIGADFPQRLARALPGRRLIVDTSGPALLGLAALRPGAAAPFALRANQAESEEMAGRPLPRLADSLAFAQDLVARGAAEVAVLARGAGGSVLAARGLALACCPPEVAVVSKIGAGDSFTGAFALALARGEGLEAALRLGTAAAASAVGHAGSGLCHGDEVARILPLCRIIRP